MRALESKVTEYRQRLRVLEVSQEQLEAGWDEARRQRETEWEERLAGAERARDALEGRCSVLEGRLGEHQGALNGAGQDARHLQE